MAVRVFGTGYDTTLSGGMWVFLFAGLIFSLINSVLKPIVIILSLPAILLTLGLFTVIVNGFMVYISLRLSPGISMTFWNSVLAGIVLSLVNYVVGGVLDLRHIERLTSPLGGKR